MMKFFNRFGFCLIFNYVFLHSGYTLIKWSRVGESNSFDQLGRLGHNQYANPALVLQLSLVRLAGIEPAWPSPRDFLTTIAFATFLVCWSGLYLHHSINALDARRLVSTPSTVFLLKLGSVLAVKPSPNLTSSTPTISSRALKFYSQVSCVYLFHHSRN